MATKPPRLPFGVGKPCRSNTTDHWAEPSRFTEIEYGPGHHSSAAVPLAFAEPVGSSRMQYRSWLGWLGSVPGASQGPLWADSVAPLSSSRVTRNDAGGRWRGKTGTGTRRKAGDSVLAPDRRRRPPLVSLRGVG